MSEKLAKLHEDVVAAGRGQQTVRAEIGNRTHKFAFLTLTLVFATV